MKQFHARKLHQELAIIEPPSEAASNGRLTPASSARAATPTDGARAAPVDPATLLSNAPQQLTQALVPVGASSRKANKKNQMALLESAPTLAVGASELCINCGVPNAVDFASCTACAQPRLAPDALAHCSRCLALNLKLCGSLCIGQLMMLLLLITSHGFARAGLFTAACVAMRALAVAVCLLILRKCNWRRPCGATRRRRNGVPMRRRGCFRRARSVGITRLRRRRSCMMRLAFQRRRPVGSSRASRPSTPPRRALSRRRCARAALLIAFARIV